MKKAGFLKRIDRMAREERAERARTRARVGGISVLLVVAALLLSPEFTGKSVEGFTIALMSMLK